ncbi:MAG: DNA polymerase III subunit gamma/tau [Firmicutes bacterium]|nr:DNA polymerase III subunit gamma/tau [Bacillota bacterium]
MSYTALYRKYRPRAFCDVIGQEHITTTLKNQIKADKISHAYLFTGSRGTGKTTCAKIFAKAVNCKSPKDGSPCGACAVCKSLDDPANIDILEIDAASNNKVDEVREIRERVKYLPVNGRFKVYIIDEVHMLTDSAFNALLKTLEEPPAHVIFILATTEAHKLPATILSRCMRFDFRLVAIAELSDLLKKVYAQEKKPFEPEALEYIAAAGMGSVRDCLSIADMCINYSDGTLTYADVLNVLGASDRGRVAELFEAVCAGDVAGVFYKIDAFVSAGKSMSLLAKDLAKYARDLLAIQAGGAALVADTKENVELMRAAAEAVSADKLVYVITEFSRIDAELRYSVSPRIALETAAVRAARLSGEDYAALSERVRVLEQCTTHNAQRTMSDGNEGTGIKAQGTGIGYSTPPLPVPCALCPDTFETNPEPRIPSPEPRDAGSGGASDGSPSAGNDIPNPSYIPHSSFLIPNSSEPRTPSPEPRAIPPDAKTVWGRLVTRFRKARNMNLYTLLSEHAEYRIEGEELVITAGDERFLRFSEESAAAELNTALIESGTSLKVRVDKKSVGIDMDKEIERITKLTGLEPRIEK